MTKELIFQLKSMALGFAKDLPGDYLGNAELIYQWLAKEALEPKTNKNGGD